MTSLTLRVKITLALLIVGLASALLVGVVAREILMRRFDDIQLNDSFARFNADVVDYFRTYGTWDKAVSVEPFGEFSRRRNQGRGGGRNGRGPRGRFGERPGPPEGGGRGGPPPGEQPDAGPPPNGGDPQASAGPLPPGGALPPRATGQGHSTVD